MQKICNMHRWSSYLLGNSMLLWCTEQLDRSECWDQSLGCPLLLLHSNPQASHCRTWAQCWCEISRQRHSQRGRCPCGSAVPCHERHTWKKDGELYLLAALQCREEHAADGEFVTTAGSGSGYFSDRLIRSKVSIKMLWDRGDLLRNWLLDFPHFFPNICLDVSQLIKGGGGDISAQAKGFLISRAFSPSHLCWAFISSGTDAIWQSEEKMSLILFYSALAWLPEVPMPQLQWAVAVCDSCTNARVETRRGNILLS